MSKTYNYWLACLGLIAIAVGYYCHQLLTTNQIAEAPEVISSFVDQETIQSAFNSQINQKSLATGKITLAIVPHHLLAASLTAESLKTVADHSYDVIVVISPNHFSRGQKKILTTSANWVTPFGYVKPDKELIARLTNDNSVGLETEVLRGEHGIGNVLPFIKYLWPDTPVVPLIIKDTQTPAESQRLAQILFDAVPNNTLVVLSEDMSHYQSPKVSRLHDATTIQALKNLDSTRVDNLDVDSRPSIQTIFAYLRLRKATHFHLVNHSDVSLIVKQPLKETTSYITGFYADR